MKDTRRTISGLGAAVLLVLAGCNGEPSGVPETEGGSEPVAGVADAAAPSEGASSRGTSPDTYLPAVGDDGSLPRTLRAYTLLDPAPADSEHEAGFPFAGSVHSYEVLRKRPLEEVRAYSREGEIFRIVYSDEDPPPFADLATIARERYGKPFQDKENEIVWIKGGSTLTLSHLQKSNITKIAIEDEDATLAAYREGQNR